MRIVSRHSQAETAHALTMPFSTDNHWVPTNFSPTAAALIGAPLAELSDGQPALASSPLVEVGVVRATSLGLVLPCINWSGEAVAGLVITLGFHLPAAVDDSRVRVSLGSGGGVVVGRSRAGFHEFTFDLEIAADAVVVRW